MIREKRKELQSPTRTPKSTIRIDLHCHSSHSDGTLSASLVARRARDCGVELFCLTDHDTFAGYFETIDVFPLGRALCGLELTCKSDGKVVHLLIYATVAGPQAAASLEPLKGILTTIYEQRCLRIFAMVDRLRTLGVTLDGNQILEQTKGGTPGRPDIARALVESGACRNSQEAFARYLRDEGPVEVTVNYPDIKSVLSIGKDLGAKMALAHPNVFRDPKFVGRLFDQYRYCGLEGLEAYIGSQSGQKRKFWCEMASSVNAVVTAGSDYHGSNRPKIANPGMDFPLELLPRLTEWLNVSSLV